MSLLRQPYDEHAQRLKKPPRLGGAPVGVFPGFTEPWENRDDAIDWLEHRAARERGGSASEREEAKKPSRLPALIPKDRKERAEQRLKYKKHQRMQREDAAADDRREVAKANKRFADFHARQERLKELEHELDQTRAHSVILERRLAYMPNSRNREATIDEADASFEKERQLEDEIRDLIDPDSDVASESDPEAHQGSDALAHYRNLKAQYKTYQAYADRDPQQRQLRDLRRIRTAGGSALTDDDRKRHERIERAAKKLRGEREQASASGGEEDRPEPASEHLLPHRAPSPHSRRHSGNSSHGPAPDSHDPEPSDSSIGHDHDARERRPSSSSSRLSRSHSHSHSRSRSSRASTQSRRPSLSALSRNF